MAITINGGTNAITGLAVGGLPDGTVDDGTLATNAVTNVKVADDAIGVAELSTTGTAGSGNYLRGDNAWTAITTGKILQVVSTTWNGTSSSTSTSFAEISSNLRVTITPTSTSNKISVTSSLSTAAGDSRQTYRMYRSIDGGAYAQADASPDGTDDDDGMYNLYTNSEAFMKMNSFTFLDAPATTDAIIYSPYWSVSGGTIYTNKCNDGSGTNRGVSTMTLMEIAG